MNFSFSFKNVVIRIRSLLSFAAAVRWGLIAISLFLFVALAFDFFIFYRYSYRVVNLKPEPVVQDMRINRMELREALGILDGRAEKFKELYGSGTTTPR